MGFQIKKEIISISLVLVILLANNQIVFGNGAFVKIDLPKAGIVTESNKTKTPAPTPAPSISPAPLPTISPSPISTLLPSDIVEPEITVIVDNKQVQFDVQPFFQNDRVLVPFRAMAEALKVKVEWDEDTQTVTAVKADKTVILRIDSNIALVNGAEVLLDAAAIKKQDRTFVPLRFFGESFNADVAWTDNPPTVTIKSKKDVAKDDKGFSPLLDHRLLIKMPEGTTVAATQDDNMDVSTNSHTETRISTQIAQGKTITISATEMFAYSSGNLKDDAKVLSEQIGMSYEIDDNLLTKNINGLDLAEIKFDLSNAYDDLNLVKAAFVRMPDNALVLVGVFVNRAAVDSGEDCLALSDVLLNTIQAGTRPIDLSSRTQTFNTMNRSLDINLSKGYVLTLERGLDFDVFYVSKMRKAGENTNSPYLGIYVGNFPLFPSESDSSVVKKLNAVILGENVEWLCYSKVGNVIGAVTSAETLIGLGDDRGTKIHLLVRAANNEDFDALKQMAESLSYTNGN